ncbi:MAG TPA: hypothetical protein VEX60_02815 [Pyrinomonadaceae bacterium]|nr:hypothetical protein [Pyrinomonadaceae bacterium]
MESLTRPDRKVWAAGHYLRPAFAYHYTVAGRFICVESDDEQAADLFRSYFGGWHVAPLDDARGVRSDATIGVQMHAQAPTVPRGLESFEVAAGGVCHTDGQTYFFESHDSAIHVGAQNPSHVEVWIGKSVTAREKAALARLAFNACMTAMRRCGLFELHGAGVVEPKRSGGVLFVGPSGSGKSTLATKLASAGWQYLSDDTLLLFRNGESIEARALRRVFAVTAPSVASGMLAGFEDLLTEPVPFDPHKRRFEPEKIFPDGFVETCVPRNIFFPVITGEPSSRTRRLSQAETMSQLIRMCPWACYDKPAARAHLGVLSLLARQSNGYELRAGADLLGDAAFVARFISASVGGEGL